MLSDRTMRDEDRGNFDRTYNTLTIEQLQHAYDAKQPTSKNKIDWLSVLRRMLYPLGIPRNIESSEKIVVEAYDYLMQLVPLLEETPDRVIVNYMQWVIVRDMIAYSGPSLQQINAKIRKEFQQQTLDTPRWLTCVDSPNLGAAISHAYSKKYVGQENIKKVDDIIMDIKNVVSSNIWKSTWMDEPTKNVSLDKLAHMRTRLGTPVWYSDEAIDKYYDGLNITDEYLESVVNLKAFWIIKDLRKLRLPVDTNEWEYGIEPTTVDGYYIATGNSMIITAAFLNDPVYDRRRPAYMNYGSVGFVIGHEVNHGFDNNGRQYDKDGNAKMWWTQEIINKYENLTKCFVKQYSSYPVPGLDNIYGKGEVSLGENIADSAGMAAAYRAYKNMKTRLNLPDVRLPGLEEYTDEQLLFVSSANVLCSNAVPERLQSLYQSEHPLEETRIRGSLSNSYDFSAVYNCPVGKRMNPTNKCILWQ